jgi:two-component system nitrogen regulation sensor histidine kinase NtrY
VVARLRARDGRFTVDVIDNGAGLPKEGRNRLVEPYMTTRDKGTGLGLAIVQKITEQHGGTLQLRDAPRRNGHGGGACIRLEFPISSAGVEEAKAAGGADGGEPHGKATAAPKRNTKRGSTRRTGKQEVPHGV